MGDTPAFRFHDDAPRPEGQAWIPRYVCRDCGHSGWLVTESGPGDMLGLDYKDIARAFGESAPILRMVHADHDLARLQETDGNAPRVAWLDATIAPGTRAALRGKGGVRCSPLSDGRLRIGPISVSVA